MFSGFAEKVSPSIAAGHFICLIQHADSLRGRRMRSAISAIFAAIVFGISVDTYGCSPMPMKYTKTQDGRFVPESGSNDYVFVGEILGEEKITAKSSASDKIITALRVRVLVSDTPRTTPGEVLNLHKFTMGGARCEHWGGESLTEQDMPIGVRVRVIARQLDIPFWEIRARFVRVE